MNVYGIVLLCVVQLASHCHAAEIGAKDYNYIAVIDAGSSGSRIYVYKWLTPTLVNNGVPEVEEVGNLKQKPGISFYADNLAGIENHLVVMINKAKELVPEDKQSTSPIYLMATAGLRFVEYNKREAMFVEIHKVFENKALSPFEYDQENARILSGEEEGAFSWISLNYNIGFFQSDAVNVSYGLLEMGGASVQIAFIPEGQILANKFVVKVGIHDYSLYIHSYLNYGQDYTVSNVREYLHLQKPTESVLDDPCMLQGDTVNDTVDSLVTFKGSGNPNECVDILKKFFWNATEDQCHPSPCTIGNVYQPPFGQKTFYAIKAFTYAPGLIGGLDSNMSLSLQDLKQKGKVYCTKELDVAVQEIGEEYRSYASAYCMMSQYIPVLLHDGLKFSTTQIIATNSVNEKSVSWTRGAVLYEIGKKCAENIQISDVTSGVAYPVPCLAILGLLVVNIFAVAC